MSSSDEVLWMVDVSIVLSSAAAGTQASQVGSFRQILARVLRSDGSVLAWRHQHLIPVICILSLREMKFNK